MSKTNTRIGVNKMVGRLFIMTRDNARKFISISALGTYNKSNGR